MKLAPLLLASSLALGCAPRLSLRTPAPPSSTLLFDGLSDHVQVTEGVAAGFEVFCFWERCNDVHATTDAPGVAQVHRAHLRASHEWGPRSPPGLALVGVAPGRTTLHVREGTRVRDVTVTVVPAAPPGAPGKAPAPP